MLDVKDLNPNPKSFFNSTYSEAFTVTLLKSRFETFCHHWCKISAGDQADNYLLRGKMIQKADLNKNSPALQ